MLFIFLLFACTGGATDSQSMSGPTVEAPKAPQPVAPNTQVAQANEEPCWKKSPPPSAFAPMHRSGILSASPMGCKASTLGKSCVSAILQRVQKIEGMACPISEVEPDFNTNHPDKYPGLHIYPYPVNTSESMATALRLVVSERLVQAYFGKIQQYGDNLAVAYPGCGGPGHEVVEHDGQFYQVMMTDDWNEMSPEERIASLTNPLKFTKNTAGAWVVDSDVSYGCWQAPVDLSKEPSELFTAVSPPAPKDGAHKRIDPGATPKAKVEVVSTDGGISKKSMQSTMRRTGNQMRYCYSKEGAPTPSMRNGVSLQFTVDPSGKAGEVSSPNQTDLNASLIRCMSRMIQRLNFGSQDQKTTATIRVSLSAE